MMLDQAKGQFAAFFTITVWASTFVVTRGLLESFGPVPILLLRFLLGYIFLWIIRPKRLHVEDKKTELLFIAAGISGVGINYLLEIYALMHTLAVNLSIIASIAPLFVGILAFFLFKQKLTVPFVLGFFCAIAGIILLSVSGEGSVQLHLFGDILGVILAFNWAVYSILEEKIHQHEYDLILVTRRLFFYGILFLLPFTFFSDMERNLQAWAEPGNILAILYLGVVACALSYVSWNYAIKSLGAVGANVWFYMQPVFSVIFSAYFLKEVITPPMLAGMVMTLGGLIVSKWKPRSRSHRTPV